MISFERMPGPIGGEPAPHSAAEAPADTTGAALRLQVLATEHWGLLATRSLVWNELFPRAGMFLSTLSAAVVALALVAQATEFGEGFVVFALVILRVVMFIGVATLIRMGKTNYYDTLCVIGMNRIRHAYLQLAPEVEPFTVMSSNDDLQGIDRTSGVAPGTSMLSTVIVSSPFVVAVINAVIGGGVGAIIAQQLSVPTPWVIAAGALGFVAVIGLQSLAAGRDISTSMAAHRAMFPAPEASAQDDHSAG